MARSSSSATCTGTCRGCGKRSPLASRGTRRKTMHRWPGSASTPGRWISRCWTKALDLPTHILPPIVAPGTVLGDLLPDIRNAIGLRHAAQVIATATHDTASAVAAVPGLDERSVYISSGTWSLVGVELDQPVLSER